MNRQILVLIILTVITGPGYIYIATLYNSSAEAELYWYGIVLLVSLWGILLYLNYKNNDFNMEQKEQWLNQAKLFLYTYFSLWTIIFILSVNKNIIELHYTAIFTQFGASVVASAILVSQRKLAIATVISLMLPIIIYFILVNELYSYLLAFFTTILSGVLIYATNNTHNYLSKSKRQTYFDYLTKLGNRHYFINLLEDSIKVQKDNHQFLYLLLIDLDHFKTINDTLGHDVGDELLIEVSSRMKYITDKYNSKISRLGGDEFCILSNFSQTKEHCQEDAFILSNALLSSIKETYQINEHTLYISASIGISIIQNPDVTASIIIKEADIAMYEAKSKGRDGLILFTDELSKKIEYKLDIERLLHFALEHKEFSLRYQPQINTKTDELGCEVLVRWHSETLGDVTPDQFIPISEQTGLIIELGNYILEEAFKTLQEWEEKGVVVSQMSINISVRQLFHSNFITDVQKLCKLYLNDKLQSKLMFEITETSTAEDISLLQKSIKSLTDLGIKFSMDDFGTGYSSLSLLHKLSIDELKIDKSFIDEIHKTENGSNMVRTILALASNLNMSVVAEGVEEAYQKDFLVEHNCDVIQGYYYSKPLLKDDFENYSLKSKK